MLTYTYVSEGTFALMEKPKPVLQHERDAIVKVTLASICSSDLHIKHGSVPRAVPGITVGHEMVGIVEEVGSAVTNVKPGDRVTVNVETFCGECFFCKKGFVNNCTDQNGGWALGCRIDGGQAEYVRVPFADQGLNKIPDGVTDRQALLVGDVLAFAAMPDEPDTAEILKRALADGKRLLLPRVRNKTEMDWVEIPALRLLRPGAFGIQEPPADLPAADPAGYAAALALVPCLAASRDGVRLGRGGGYYDRFLAHYKGAGLLLCPEALLLDELPCDDWDARFAPENILTEKGILR